MNDQNAMRYRARLYSAPEWIHHRAKTCVLTYRILTEWAMGDQDTPALTTSIAQSALAQCDTLMDQLKRQVHASLNPVAIRIPKPYALGDYQGPDEPYQLGVGRPGGATA